MTGVRELTSLLIETKPLKDETAGNSQRLQYRPVALSNFHFEIFNEELSRQIDGAILCFCHISIIVWISAMISILMF